MLVDGLCFYLCRDYDSQNLNLVSIPEVLIQIWSGMVFDQKDLETHFTNE